MIDILTGNVVLVNIPKTVTAILARLTQVGDYRITQAGDYRIDQSQ